MFAGFIKDSTKISISCGANGTTTGNDAHPKNVVDRLLQESERTVFSS